MTPAVAVPVWQACYFCHTVDRGDGIRVHESAPEVKVALLSGAARLSHAACGAQACQDEQTVMLRRPTDPAYQAASKRQRDALLGMF